MKTLAVVAFLLLAAPAFARDPKQVVAFKKDHPCPATGTTGACNGWVVDHVIPLCLGGPDTPANMKWQTKTESYLKDVFEREMCEMKRKLEIYRGEQGKPPSAMHAQ